MTTHLMFDGLGPAVIVVSLARVGHEARDVLTLIPVSVLRRREARDRCGVHPSLRA